MNSPKERHAVTIFFVLSFLITILAALVLHVMARQAGLSDFGELISMAETTFTLGTIANLLPVPPWIVYLLSRIADFGPSLAGLLTALYVGGLAEVRGLLSRVIQLAASRKAYLAAFLIPAGIIFAAFILNALLGGIADSSSADWQGVSTIGWLLFWVFIARTLLGGGLGEEIGWRGFALPRLQARHGAFKASLIIGVVWALWHFPVAFVAEDPLVNIIALILFVIPQGFTYTWVYNHSRGSLLPVILMHGASNGLSVFMERTLYPHLLEDDTWVIIYILGTLLVGIVMAVLVRRQDRVSFQEK